MAMLPNSWIKATAVLDFRCNLLRLCLDISCNATKPTEKTLEKSNAGARPHIGSDRKDQLSNWLGSTDFDQKIK